MIVAILSVLHVSVKRSLSEGYVPYTEARASAAYLAEVVQLP